MLQEQCVSVTDLRTKTKFCLEGLDSQPKYIFINNRPVAVILDIHEYEEHFARPELIQLRKDEVTEDMLKKAAKARKTKRSDLINI